VDLYPSVESNNLQLNVLKQEIEANSLERRSEINMADPEVGLTYLWGDKNAPSDKRMLSVNQELDLVTISGSRKRLVNSQNKVSKASYIVERQDVLKEFSENCVMWRYLTKQLEQRNATVQILSQLFESYEKQLNAGELSRIEFNKMQFSIAEYTTQIRLLELERESIFRQLVYLNGNVSLDTTYLHYENSSLPTDFEVWFDSVQMQIPEINFYSQNLKVSAQEEKLARLSWLPKLNAGYQSEISNVEAMRGGSIGFSLPLWENKNAVKSKVASSKMAELRLSEAVNRIKNEYFMKYQRILAMTNLLNEYMNAMTSMSNLTLESKAFRLGAMSASDYLRSTADYISLYDKVLEIEYLIQREKIEFMLIQSSQNF
jgi:outer membrane protein TolC